MTDSTQRFSDRVANYIKYRPGYPGEMLQFFREEMGLRESSVIADVGSGTGISAKFFLDNGNTVYGVEPNDAMRAAAQELLESYPNFHSIKGRSDKTGLDPASIDLVTAAQAFHWFDPDTTRIEFRRILKRGGYIALIWNERQLDTTAFHKDYEQFLLKFASDYSKVRHENVNTEKLRDFFQGDFETRVFSNSQILDFEGLKGRILSSSYMPTESDERYAPMAEELARLFAKHEEHGRIKVLYDTKVHYYQV